MLVLSLENERLCIAGVLGHNFHGFYAINFFVIGKSNAFSLQTDNVCDSSWKRVTPKSHNISQLHNMKEYRKFILNEIELYA
jgi:hypothetical protein